MTDVRRICRAEELGPGAVFFEALVGGERRPCFAVATSRGPAGYVNVCAHRNQPVVVDEGDPFTDGLVECRAHGAMYEPATGECVEGPCAGARLVPVTLVIEDGAIFAVDDDLVDDSVYADDEEG